MGQTESSEASKKLLGDTPAAPPTSQPAETPGVRGVVEMSLCYKAAEAAGRARLIKLTAEFESTQQVCDCRTLDKILCALETDCLSPYSGVVLSADNKYGPNIYESDGLIRLLDALDIERTLLRSSDCWSSEKGKYLSKDYRFKLKRKWVTIGARHAVFSGDLLKCIE